MNAKVSESYLAEGARLLVVADYLRHEAAKRDGKLYGKMLDEVSCQTSERHATALASMRASLATGSSVEELLAATAIEERWVLFHAVSWGCLAKELANCVGDPGFSWLLEKRPLREIVFESPVGPLRNMSVHRPTFLDAVDFLRGVNGDDNDRHELVDPLIGRTEGSSVVIHDGNGRLLSYAYAVRDGRLSDSASIDIWVGQTRAKRKREEGSGLTFLPFVAEFGVSETDTGW